MENTVKCEAVIKVAGAAQEAFASFRIAGQLTGSVQQKFATLELAKQNCETLCASKGVIIQWGAFNQDVNTLIGTYEVQKPAR